MSPDEIQGATMPYGYLQIVGVTPQSFRVELNARCCCAVFYSQLTSKVIHARSVQAVVYSWVPRGVVRILLCHCTFVIIELHHAPQIPEVRENRRNLR